MDTGEDKISALGIDVATLNTKVDNLTNTFKEQRDDNRREREADKKEHKNELREIKDSIDILSQTIKADFAERLDRIETEVAEVEESANKQVNGATARFTSITKDLDERLQKLEDEREQRKGMKKMIVILNSVAGSALVAAIFAIVRSFL